MEIKTEFLRDEVRSGFYIPTSIKQAWAVQLLVLREIDRICRKYNITYFADWGTLLGTVRHGGYIPWDDDLDICMKREDYMRFRQVADKELPKDFAIHDYERKEDHWLFLSRVINKNQICFDKEHLDKYYNFPYIATVDIFVLDYLYKDEEQERKRCDEVKYLIALAELIVNDRLSFNAKESELKKIEKLYDTMLDATESGRDIGIKLYRLAEQQMARVKEHEADRIGQIFPWVLKGAKGLPKEYYEKVVYLPFEMGTMPVPGCYHKVLSDRYGDYFKVHKVWTGHNYPYFEGQRENLMAQADFSLPEFRFSKNMLRNEGTELDATDSLKGMVNQCLIELDNMLKDVSVCIENGEYCNVVETLINCQQLAIDMGTLIENVRGEDSVCARSVIPELESFCEEVFSLYENIQALCEKNYNMDIAETSKKTMSLLQAFSVVKEQVTRQLIDKKVVLFVTTGAKQWKGFKSLYLAAVADDKAEVHVVFAPVMPKDVLGQVKLSNEDVVSMMATEVYPENIKIYDWSTYSLSLNHPDMIFIQEQYDGENGCLTIPPQYYAEKLQKFTSKLVYVPSYVTEEFDEKDTTALYNMKHFVATPGFMYADIILAQSENIKKHWVEALVEFAGEDTKELWEKKILPMGLPVMDELTNEAKHHKKRKILFGVGLSSALELGDKFLPWLKDRFSVFEGAVNSLDVGIYVYPADMRQWDNALGKEITQEVIKILQDKAMQGVCHLCHMDQLEEKDLLREYDAYYGSASPLAHGFSNLNKPVMLGEILSN